MNKIIYYDHFNKFMHGRQYEKARAFNQHDCVQEVADRKWVVQPILGYNKRTYVVTHTDGGWDCNCQFNVMRKMVCSHIMAVNLRRRER